MSIGESLADRLTEADGFLGRRGASVTGSDPVNLAMIRRWCQALGDHNPVYLDELAARTSVYGDLIAPPSMLEVWTMPGYGASPPTDDAVAELHAVLDGAGYSSTVSTKCEQEYMRPLRVGDRVSTTKTIQSVSDKRSTPFGPGFQITTAAEVTDSDGTVVGRHLHQVLKYQSQAAASGEVAAQAKPAALRPRPVMTKDTAFFWEGAREHRLLIQRCAACRKLRHPPTAACANCGALQWDVIESAGNAELYSYTVVHAPVVAPFEPPYVVALVELEEGTRLISQLVDVDPSDAWIGMPLKCEWLEADPELTLPVFRPAPSVASTSHDEGTHPHLRRTLTAEDMNVDDRLPTLRIPLSRSLIVAAAIASGDYQPMHHDPDAARTCGLEDVSMNILTSTGLVGRYITDWAGPDCVLRKIAIEVGVPNYPGDTLELTGKVAATEVYEHGCHTEIVVLGRNSRGEHLTGTVSVTLDSQPGAQR
jgi:uncharacterized OB-fold protein/acyl dehydratase